MSKQIIVNDLGSVSLRGIINFLLVVLVLGVAVSLLVRYGKRTFKSMYTEAGQCAPDKQYEYKDPYIHGC